MYRLVLESLLGVTLERSCLRFTPCLPVDWTGFRLRYRYRDTSYDITLRQTIAPAGSVVRPTTLLVDGIAQADALVHLVDDRATHRVEVDVQAASTDA
jgi:cellobiose phosphorylase